MTTKSLLVSLIAAAALASATAQATSLKLSHVRPQNTAIDQAAAAFADDVATSTEGELNIRLFPANALGDYTIVQERVSLGAVDMAVQPPASGADKRFQLAYLPYLVRNWDDAKRVFEPGAPMREEIESIYASQDIRVLAAWPVYFGGIALNSDVENPADPSADKGAKLRVPPMKSFQLMADNIGYIGSPLPFSDAFTAVQTGVVDGVMGSGAEGYYASFRDVTNTYVPLNTHFEVWYLLINEGVYSALDDAARQALSEAAARFESARWENAQADQAHNEQLLAEAGATLIEVDDAQIDATASIVREKVWPVILDDIGADWAQSVLDQVIE